MKRSLLEVEPLYAAVALDLEVKELRDRLFSYSVPAELTDEIFVGSQVLVPFGHRNLVGGYIVSLDRERPPGLKLVKPVAEVVDPDPLFDREYVDFLRWLAETTCSQLSDVVQAALPSCVLPRLKRSVRLTNRPILEISADRSRTALLDILRSAGNSSLSLQSLRRRFTRGSRQSQSEFYRLLNALKHEGLVEVATESGNRASTRYATQVTLTGQQPESKRQKEIVALLEENQGEMPLTVLLKSAGTTHQTVRRLEQSGVVRLEEKELFRDPLASLSLEASGFEPPTLTSHQSTCLEVLEKELQSPTPSPSPWLLHGVTGSGKTEVYLRLIRKALDSGRTALLLVPEISLTPQLASRLKERFGELVSVWHSGISAGERYDTWKGLRTGRVRVLLGARSACLANIPDLGLIILDEEHDGSYKQSNPSPRYNARTVAIERARRSGALVLLGSATPDVVTYWEARAADRILSLPERVHRQAMPRVNVVDMRQELKLGNKSIFSVALKEAIEETMALSEQAILLLNRRGYASHVFCRACGHVVSCKHCSVALVYHKDNHRDNLSDHGARGHLSCHHCGASRGMTEACPECKSPFIKEFGLGTQKVEECVREQFPDARVVRLDSDVAARKGAFKEVLDCFVRGDADILIGTQMVSKGLDIPRVTLVGVLAADAALNMPDYRSSERGFQLLSQVAGRAGRGDRPGRVIMQTYNPELPIFDWASHHDFDSFLETELDTRKLFSYPPFSRIIRVVVSGVHQDQVDRQCTRIKNELEALLVEGTAEVLGPAPCLIERVRGKYRHHLLVKLAREAPGQTVIDFLKGVDPDEGTRIAVDVDALDLL
ncbi:MAG: primosomal protein N' [Cyanobacteria bacterium HKST-UBA02]|nr:primosomal protein N' [Cyanobacteria bacterium HKST-UBA02]